MTPIFLGKENYEKQMDIFSNFFVKATMKKEAVDRQLAAVDSEFDLRREAFCIELMEQTALMEPNHPQSHFNAGNRLSLTTYPKEHYGIGHWVLHFQIMRIIISAQKFKFIG